MITIPLSAIPNQTFSIALDSNNFNISLYATGNVMAADITINNVITLTSVRVVPGSLIIPYEYLEYGNFALITLNDAYPYYTEFNVTQFLIYISAAELEVLRG